MRGEIRGSEDVAGGCAVVEAVPQAEAFPTGENDRTRKCFGLCELYGAQHCRDGVNNPPGSLIGIKGVGSPGGIRTFYFLTGAA